MRTAYMVPARALVSTILLYILLSVGALAGENVGHSGFMVGLQSGYGDLTLHSDQIGDMNQGTFSLGFQGGYAVTARLIVGLEVGGWLLESFTFDAHGDEEERGESISHAMVFLHLFPINRLPVYLRAAVGHADYKNNRWDGNGGSGWGSWLIGVGYEMPLSHRFYVATQIGYSSGHFSDVPEILGKETGRGYDVLDVSVAIRWYSGR